MSRASQWSLEVQGSGASSHSSHEPSSSRNGTMNRLGAERVDRWLRDGNAPGAVPSDAQGRSQCRMCYLDSVVATLEKRPPQRCLDSRAVSGHCSLWN
ncbi:hypothetical protein CDD80_4298 [Ophiocordyceps camponoti-rufipedis]|uniref:Uncharacterized protein n=1 Tax=Ophiocordyceps camponoti-rufipedis TaxID=2004952 RepID=A0A2C5YVB8_9HYPO|nr:hypothetical protein CDD80_4298 [Ophiocordyceps camponoti-rufipedis]